MLSRGYVSNCAALSCSMYSTQQKKRKHITYSLFHKTLPIFSLHMHWIFVRFYEMGDMSV